MTAGRRWIAPDEPDPATTTPDTVRAATREDVFDLHPGSSQVTECLCIYWLRVACGLTIAIGLIAGLWLWMFDVFE